MNDNAKTDNGIRLNKYLSEAGICSRREADRLIEASLLKTVMIGVFPLLYLGIGICVVVRRRRKDEPV